MQKELKQIAEKIREYQQNAGLSDAEMCRRFGDLGHTKTYGKILAGDVADLDLEHWLLDYQAVWNVIEALAQGQAPEEPLYDDLSPVVRLRLAVTDAMRETGNNRLVIVQGPSGSGKSKAALLLKAKFGQRVIMAEANQTWKESLNAMLSGILQAAGVASIPMSASGKLEALVARLREARVCLVIDEAHHLGPATLNLVKTLINRTPGEIVLLAMGILWNRLETDAYQEARQLTLNRLCERIRLVEMEAADVEKILDRRLSLNGELKPAVAALMNADPRYRSLNFVSAVVKRVLKTCPASRGVAPKGEADLDAVSRAIAKTGQSR